MSSCSDLDRSTYRGQVLTGMCPKVPDPPGNLQLSCDHGEDGKVQVSWSAPDKAHGLIREYIVSLDWGPV